MEVNLLSKLDGNRDRRERLALRRSLSQRQRTALCEFGEEYFDGPTGYGGYYYDGRHAEVVADMIERYGLTDQSTVLEVGCAKGFMLYEFVRHGVTGAQGCDISTYAVEHAHEGIRQCLSTMSADDLSYDDRSFDLVYSIDVVHNLPPDGCDQAIREIMRVSRGCCFVQVASFADDDEERALREWGVTVQTLRSKTGWREVFQRLGYRGDYFFKVF